MFILPDDILMKVHTCRCITILILCGIEFEGIIDTLQAKKLKGQPLTVEVYDPNESYFLDTSDNGGPVIMDLGMYVCMYVCMYMYNVII